MTFDALRHAAQVRAEATSLLYSWGAPRPLVRALAVFMCASLPFPLSSPPPSPPLNLGRLHRPSVLGAPFEARQTTASCALPTSATTAPTSTRSCLSGSKSIWSPICRASPRTRCAAGGCPARLAWPSQIAWLSLIAFPLLCARALRRSDRPSPRAGTFCGAWRSPTRRCRASRCCRWSM